MRRGGGANIQRELWVAKDTDSEEAAGTETPERNA